MRFMLCSALVVLCAAPAASAQAWGTLPEALTQAQASGGVAMVYVSAAWCGPCHRLRRETFADDAVRQRLARFALARLDLEDRDRHHSLGPYRLSEAEWAERLGATVPPALVFLDAEGAVVGRHSGFLPPDGLIPILDAALDAATSQ